jgi:hypothetical protein
MKTNLQSGGGETVRIVVNAVLGTMTGLGMRGLDSSANAEVVEMSLPFRALPPNISLHWTGSSRFSLFSIATSLAAAPGQ